MLNEKILDEYNVVRNNVGLFDFSIEGKIKVSGNGRVDFINNLVSNDIKKLEVNNGIYAAFLDKLGKVLSDCVIYKFENFILINLNIIGKINIIKKLKDEAPLVKSEIEDITLKYGLFSLQGPKSIELLKEIINDNLDLKNQYQCTIKKITIKEKNNNNENNNQLINNKTNARTTSSTNSVGIEKNKNNINNNKIEIIVTKNKRTTEDGYDIFVPASMYKEFKELILEKGKKYNLKIINNETYNILRLEAKIPLYSIDFNQNNILPEITEKAISYEKGCFLGQEILARVKSLAKGITAKKLMFLEIDSKEVPGKNSKIMKDNNEVGHITSAAFSPELNKVVALGFLNKGYYDPGSIVTINNSKAIIKLL